VLSATTLTSVMVVLGAAAFAPWLGDVLGRWLLVPTVVLEVLLGILIGPHLLGWVRVDEALETISELGLAMLMFLAGYELDFRRVRGGPLRVALLTWLATVVLALLTSLVVLGPSFTAMVVGLALTTTALGAVLPMIRDRGGLGTPLGRQVLAHGAVGEFAPVVAVSLVLTSTRPAHTGLLLFGFALLAAFGVWWARRPRSPRVARLMSVTLGTSVQFAVRTALLVVIGMVWAAAELGLDVLLGAFAAGIVLRSALEVGDPGDAEVVLAKLEGMGYGFLVPFFFVVSGARFDLASLMDDPLDPVWLLLFALLLLLLRGGPVWWAAGRGRGRSLDQRGRVALALLSATALPLIVVITTVGVERGALHSATAATLVGAGVLSVLVFPLIALRVWPDERKQLSEPRQ